LFFIVGKQKYRGTWKRIKSPIIVISIIILIYIAFWVKGFQIYQYGVDNSTDLTEIQISNLPYYYVPVFAWFNAPIYVAFYLVFWWFLRCCTMEEVDNGAKEITSDTEEPVDDLEYFDYEYDPEMYEKETLEMP
jgi:hypothetical protein